MRKYLLLFAGTILGAFYLQGCLTAESDFDRRVREDDEAIDTYLEENNITAEKTHSGVHVEVMEENEQGRQVQEGHVAGILYTIKELPGERVIESHTDTLRPVRFSHTANALIPAGLNYEIDRMREGEKFRFYVPSYQAFGNYGHSDLFAPHSNFIIEVDLVELKTEEEIYEQELDSIRSYIEQNNIEAAGYPNGLYYVETQEGYGSIATDHSLVKFHFTRKYLDGTVIETTAEGDPIHVSLNDNKLVRGLENGIKLMKEGGKATLIMPSKLAFGKSRQVIPRQVREDWVDNGEIQPLVDPYASIIYEVELLEVKR